MKQTILLSIIIFFLTACGGGATVTQTIENAPVNVNKSELLTLVNQARGTSRMCGNTSYPATGNLQWDDKLEQAAQNHSDDMNSNNFFNHTSSNGAILQTRLTLVGHTITSHAGENIAKGYSTEQSVVEGWFNSDGHCANMMNPNFTHMGVATAGPYWTQVFAN